MALSSLISASSDASPTFASFSSSFSAGVAVGLLGLAITRPIAAACAKAESLSPSVPLLLSLTTVPSSLLLSSLPLLLLSLSEVDRGTKIIPRKTSAVCSSTASWMGYRGPRSLYGSNDSSSSLATGVDMVYIYRPMI